MGSANTESNVWFSEIKWPRGFLAKDKCHGRSEANSFNVYGKRRLFLDTDYLASVENYGKNQFSMIWATSRIRTDVWSTFGNVIESHVALVRCLEPQWMSGLM
jgi:hypothetical protein